MLSDVAFASKSHWPYLPAQLLRWTSVLQVTPSEIARWPTVTAWLGDRLAGFYQLRPLLLDICTLEHFWLVPEFVGMGRGRFMLADATERARAAGAAVLRIESDPYAEAFYLACGAVRVTEVAAPIEGAEDRVLPILELALEQPRQPRQPPRKTPPL
jgi:GNAT superfamily N-acetyltransferase